MNEQEFETLLQKYADVTVRVGLNLRAGQKLSIRGILEDAPFVRKVVKSAYEAGARYVDVLWTDETISRLHMEKAPLDALSEVPDWLFHRMEEYQSKGEAQLAISSSNPDLLNGVDSERIATYRKSVYLKLVEPLRKYENFGNWCVVATATPAWAKKVFPDLPTEEAQKKLWETIFKACRIDQPDPVKAWQEHVAQIDKRKNYLNTKRYAALHYQAPGTDLTVGLPEDHLWSGAQETFKNGVTCTVNIPTEEVFTLPHKEKADGVVKSTMPLNLGGVLIEDFSVTFENGRAVQLGAKKGEADLKKHLEMDENAARLGEVALVPHSSPIRRSGVLFYNTLFDENASCHLAFGSAYKSSLKGGDEMNDEEFGARGGNKSLIHTDFMIGSAELNVDGIRADGSREALLRGGEWAFEA